jgi:hypothetical protein
MPLNSITLKQALLPFMAPPNTAGYPKTFGQFGASFAQALTTYYSLCTIPSLTIANAELSCKALSLTVPDPPVAVYPRALEQLVETYFAVYAPGTLPAFATTLPPVPIDFSPVYVLGTAGATGESIVSLFATIIDAWARTALAVQTSTGVAIPYS